MRRAKSFQGRNLQTKLQKILLLSDEADPKGKKIWENIFELMLCEEAIQKI